jgi:hypothetical protein
MKRSERWGLVHVEPVGRQKTFAFVNPGGLEEIEMLVYPEATRESGDRLRAARVALGMGLRAASQRLGLSAVELSAVERGAMTGDVDAMIAELEASR